MLVVRCDWGNSDNKTYQMYHDYEWGKLNLDNSYLYEMLVLESFQSGLSWETILNKRENFKKAFANFDYRKVARFTDDDVAKLMRDKGIVRNKLKIQAAINNAKIFVRLDSHGTSFSEFLQGYFPNLIVNEPENSSQVAVKSRLSERISKDMKKIGFKFVGPVTIYSFLQAVGLVNDHVLDCSFKF